MHAARSVDRWRARNQRVLEALMIPFPMVVIDEFRHGPAEVALPKRNHPIETFLFDRSHESSSAGESHPRALPEPYVKLSPHTAPTIQPPASRRAATGQRASGPRARWAPARAGARALDAENVCISVAPMQRGPRSDAGARAHTSTDRIGRSSSPSPVSLD